MSSKPIQLPTAALDLVPHDQPMSLLDQVIESNDNGVVASVTVTEQSAFATDQGVPSWVGIEYMGQAIAAHAGLIARSTEQPVKVGFLVSVRRYEPGVEYFPLGSELRVKVAAVTEYDAGLNVFACEIHGPNIHIKANLNVFMPENTEQFMQENSLS